MARKVNQFTDLDKRIADWLMSKGVDTRLVKNDYIVTRSGGQTMITLTMYADDFMTEAEHAYLACTDLTTCRQHQQFVDHIYSACLNPATCAQHAPMQNPHGTCINTKTVDDEYPVWMCGPECPPVTPEAHAYAVMHSMCTVDSNDGCLPPKAPDDNCVTLPDGDCVSEKPCMHNTKGVYHGPE